MKISSVNSVKLNRRNNPSNGQTQGTTASVSNPNSNVAFTGKPSGLKKLLSKILPKPYDHEFLPRTIDEAVEYIKRVKGVKHSFQRHQYLDYTWLRAYKDQNVSLTKDVHEYLFVNKGRTLFHSTSYDSKGEMLKYTILREDGTKETVQHFLNGRSHNKEIYRKDGTLESIAKYDDKYEFLGFQNFDSKGIKETTFQHPERHSGELIG